MKIISKIALIIIPVLLVGSIVIILFIPEDIEKPAIKWGIGVYPAYGFSNGNLDDWDEAFIKAKTVGNIAHLEVTYGEMSIDDAKFLYDIKVPRAKENNMDTFLQINTFGTIP